MAFFLTKSRYFSRLELNRYPRSPLDCRAFFKNMEIDIKGFQRALSQIAQERGIPAEKIIETIEAAMATAYKKDYGQKGQKIKAKFNPVSGAVKFWQVKLVVDKDMLYTEEEIEKLKEEKELPAVEASEPEEGKKIVFNPEKHICSRT